MKSNKDKRDQSEFNMAVSYLNRLNTLFYVCDEASSSLDASVWYHTLCTIYRELSTEMNPEEIKNFDSEMMKINTEINKYINNQYKGLSKLDSNTYFMLHKFELKLRHILKDSGLQQKIVDSAEMALR